MSAWYLDVIRIRQTVDKVTEQYKLLSKTNCTAAHISDWDYVHC